MSLDLFVIVAAASAPNGQAWSRALTEANAPVSFTQTIDPQRDSGFFPMKVNGRASGFYLSIDSYSELVAHYPSVEKLPVADPIVYSLNYGGHADECVAAFESAAVLVTRFHGIAFDPQAGKILTASELHEVAALCSHFPPQSH